MASKAGMFHLLALALVFSVLTMHRACGEQDCEDDKYKFMAKCMAFVEKGPYINPSTSCCQTIREIDMPCVCRTILPKEEKEINVHRMVWIAAVCGNPVPAGEKCGSE